MKIWDEVLDGAKFLFMASNEAESMQSKRSRINKIKKTCSVCRWWYKDPEQHWIHECRRRSPQIIIKEKINNESAWPPTDYDDWCGDFEKREV